MNELAKSTLRAKALAHKWNESFPIGTPVRYWTGARNEGPGKTSRTRTQASTLNSYTPVVWLEGVPSCIALSHIEPLPEERKFMTAPRMTPEEHRQRHIELHKAFDELIADYLAHHPPKNIAAGDIGKVPSNTTVAELMEWSHQQTIEPEEL